MGKSLALGRPRKVQQNTFALNDGEFDLISKLVGFGRVVTLLAEHRPFMKAGDIVKLRCHRLHLVGEASVLDCKTIQTKAGARTAMAVQLIEREVGGNE